MLIFYSIFYLSSAYDMEAVQQAAVAAAGNICVECSLLATLPEPTAAHTWETRPPDVVHQQTSPTEVMDRDTASFLQVWLVTNCAL